jgi:hypothetical protein
MAKKERNNHTTEKRKEDGGMRKEETTVTTIEINRKLWKNFKALAYLNGSTPKKEIDKILRKRVKRGWR